MTTLGTLKNRKAELRTIMHDFETEGQLVDEVIFIEYQTVVEQLSVADSKLMKPVDRCARCKWLHE